MKEGIGLAKIGAMIDVYPTLSEVARKAADQSNKKRLTCSLEKCLAGSTNEGVHECLEDMALEMDRCGPGRDRRDRGGEIPSHR